MKQSTIIFNEAVERMALSLEPRHWQAFVAEMGMSYPYSFLEKIRTLREIINKNSMGKEAEDV